MPPILRILITGPATDDLQTIAAELERSTDSLVAGWASLDTVDIHVDELQIDAVLMLYRFATPGILRIIRTLSEHLPVLLVSSASEDATADGLLSGACCALPHDATPAEIACAIRTVGEDGVSCPDAVAYELFDRLHGLRAGRTAEQCLVHTDLTFQEVGILRLLSAGLSNKQIAERTNLSVHTVKNYVHRILQQLGAHSRFEAATYFQTLTDDVKTRPAGDRSPVGLSDLP
jgi:DNA-binding NarL/FixJ family response regulator